ncbi:unnamed protein product [Soboliphyme baturini]|uniref:Endo/exonuclease/phosphatase domain-containing protein n=1 Tax=Soboliphyme baturini TaxID=241478 RepID=A0A183IEK1_9BILA|nr:unnamed protein product [Soboliphyme baturini]
MILSLRNCAQYDVPNTKSLIDMGDFNAHFGTDTEKWKVAFGKNRPSDLNKKDMKLLRFCANNGLSITNTRASKSASVHLVPGSLCTEVDDRFYNRMV